MIRLNCTHLFSHFKFTSKIFKIYTLSFSKMSSESSKIPSICPKIPRIMLHSHYLYFLFRCMPRQRTLWNSSKSSRICSIYPQTPWMTQNLHHLFTHYILCFRCLTIGRELSKIPANQAEFAQFAHRTRELCAFCTKILPHLVHYFQTSDHRQRTLENWSELTRFCAVRPQLQWITRNSLNPHP